MLISEHETGLPLGRRVPSESGEGCVYWVTGLAGVGKTTVATELHRLLLAEGRRSVLLDGDSLRAALGERYGYDVDDRRYLAESYGRLCAMLANQGCDVVCATVSMFDSVRDTNRQIMSTYYEIYLTAPLGLLRTRRSIYEEAHRDDVVGMNDAYELPRSADITMHNGGDSDPAAIAVAILRSLRSPTTKAKA